MNNDDNADSGWANERLLAPSEIPSPPNPCAHEAYLSDLQRGHDKPSNNHRRHHNLSTTTHPPPSPLAITIEGRGQALARITRQPSVAPRYLSVPMIPPTFCQRERDRSVGWGLGKRPHAQPRSVDGARRRGQAAGWSA